MDFGGAVVACSEKSIQDVVLVGGDAEAANGDAHFWSIQPARTLPKLPVGTTKSAVERMFSGRRSQAER